MAKEGTGGRSYLSTNTAIPDNIGAKSALIGAQRETNGAVSSLERKRMSIIQEAGGLHARVAKLRGPGNAKGGAPRRVNSTLVWRAGEADEKTFPVHLYRFLRDTLR